MTGRWRSVALVALILGLTGCTVPRSAGFEAEVLAARDGDAAEAAADFAVVEVTRDTLALIAAWPLAGAGGHHWIAAQGQPSGLLIAPGDVLKVTVWDAEENSLLTTAGTRVAELQDLTVSADGRIFVPFVGELRVAGMSEQTARARIEEELVATVPSAQVQVQVVPGRSNTAHLVSGVTRPGVYALPGRDTSVLGLIAEGGGINPGLKNPQVTLFRGNAVYRTSVTRLFDSPAADTVLRGGDRVIVEEDERAFLSLGAANRQARHLFPTDRVSALDALATIGGVEASRADPEGVLILRQYPAAAVRDGISGPPRARMVFAIDLTTADGLFSAGEFRVADGDLVYATESPLGAARTVLGLVAAGVDLFGQIN